MSRNLDVNKLDSTVGIDADKASEFAASAGVPVTVLSPMDRASRGSNLVQSLLRGITWNGVVFTGLMLAMLVPLWSVERFPSQDGPMHAYNAVVYRDYDRPDRAIFREFFIRNSYPVPNWICPHLLPQLMRFMPAVAAEKLLLSIYLLALPLAIRYALLGIRRRSARLAIMALPFVPNYFFHMGFQDFSLSLAGFFIVVGYWLHLRRNFAWRHGGILSLLLILLYFMHGLSAVMAMLTLTATAVPFYTLKSMSIARRGRCTRLAALPRAARQLLPVGVAMLPTAILTLMFVVSHHGSTLPWDPWPNGYFHRFYYLLSWMKGYRFIDLIPAGIELTLLYGVGVWLFWRRRQRGAARSLKWIRIGPLGGLVVAATIVGWMFVSMSDSEAGGSMLLVRLPAFAAFAMLLWCAAQPLGSRTFRRLELSSASVAVVVLLVMIVSQLQEYALINRYLREFDSLATLVEPNSTLAPLRFSDARTVDHGNDGTQRLLAAGIDPFLHAEGIGLAERGVIDIGDYGAMTDHYSLRWRPQFCPPLQPDVDTPWNLAAHEQRIGRPIDYVVLWTGGIPHTDLSDQFVYSELRTNYDLIYISDSKYLELFRRKMDWMSRAEPTDNK